MHASLHGERTLTALDLARLNRLDGSSLPPELEDLLGRADVVASEAVAADVVTMYSQIELRDTRTGRRQKLTICYPKDAEPAAGFISVLSPVGRSVIGLRLHSVARWATPSGDEISAEIVAIVFQPEASGDYKA